MKQARFGRATIKLWPKVIEGVKIVCVILCFLTLIYFIFSGIVKTFKLPKEETDEVPTCLEVVEPVLEDILVEEEPEIDPEELKQKQILAQLVMSEAGNQPLTGMRFVADVVLNRVDDPRFPDTIFDVINQKSQFSVIDNGLFDAMANYISDDAWLAVELEWDSRLDYGILYFSSTTNPVNGERAFKYYDHWFSY